MKQLYLVTYSLLHGETMSYNHQAYTHAYSPKQATLNIKRKLSHQSLRMREVNVRIIHQQEVSPSFQQLSFFK